MAVEEAQRERIAALASDSPQLWQDLQTPDREKKRMVRLLFEDVTVLKRDQIQGTSASEVALSKASPCHFPRARRLGRRLPPRSSAKWIGSWIITRKAKSPAS